MRALGSVLLVLLLGGCAAGEEGGAAEDAATTPSAPRSSAPAPEDRQPEPPAVPAEDPPPCADVRAGIDAFNAGNPEETVARFEVALPKAEQYVADRPGRTADLLLEAVEYYVALPPEDYAAALTGSAEFRRHQVVTLAVCRYDAPAAPQESDEAVPA